MARKHEHEDHVNHEAWAIPYGDLVTLLLAFFVVMYATSSINEGKYRVASDSLSAAFHGAPRTMEPVPVGEKPAKGKGNDNLAGIQPNQAIRLPDTPELEKKAAEDEALQIQLRQMTDDLQNAMQVLIDQQLIRVQRTPSWVEVEIKTDILFPSGSAQIEAAAVPILERLAGILSERPYPIRIEGHTDNRPIKTAQFPSNWELSAARAARIVRLFEERGIAPTRMVVAGMGENQPLADNGSAEGRNRNRRVALVILGVPPGKTDPLPGGLAMPRRERCGQCGACGGTRHYGGYRMKPVDHVNPIVPGNWVRRVEKKQRQRDPGKGQQENRDPKQPPGQDPDGRSHIIDDLA